MKKWIKRLLKFAAAPILILVVLAILVLIGWRANLQSAVAQARQIDSPNGIDLIEAIEIGGTRQWIQVRGHDQSNPILLFLHGGPGSAMMPLGHVFQTPWEEHFTVAQWDQRESGKSYRGEGNAETMTTERMIMDTLEVVDYLRERFDQDKIVVTGHSWGTYLGLNVIQLKPEWFHAYVGVGQVVNMQENERVTYEYTLQQAKEHGDAEALAELEALAPYPSPEKIADKMMVQRKWLMAYGGSLYGEESYAPFIGAILASPDYSWLDIYRFATGMEFVMDYLLDPLHAVDITALGTEYQVPIFIFSGRYDYQVPSVINEAWFETITAPHKEYIWFEESCHSPMLAEVDRFTQELVKRVLPFTQQGESAETDVDSEAKIHPPM